MGVLDVIGLRKLARNGDLWYILALVFFLVALLVLVVYGSRSRVEIHVPPGCEVTTTGERTEVRC